MKTIAIAYICGSRKIDNGSFNELVLDCSEPQSMFYTR